MINSLKDGIVARLNELYPSIKVYTEKRSHGVSKTAFQVEIRPISIDRVTKNIEEHSHLIVVSYFQEREINATLYDVVDNLSRNLTSCMISGSEVVFRNNRIDVVDGVLHFQFEIDYRVFLKPEQPGQIVADIQITNS